MTLPKSLEKIVDKFIELHGDRAHGETEQVRCGLGWIGEQRFVIVLHVHRDSRDLSIGYRKSLRMLRLAEQLKKPVLWYVENTEAAESNLSLDLLNNINENIRTILNLKIPIIGVFSSSNMINFSIVDHAILLTDRNTPLETSREDVEIINPDDLPLLKSRLIDKFTEIAQISSSYLISQRTDRINL